MGVRSAKKKITSRTHKGKFVSELTRRKIGEKCSARPGSLLNVFGEKHPCWKGGYGRSVTEQSTQDYIWKNAVRKRCRGLCIVSGEKKNVECHHINGWNRFPDQRNHPENGVLLHKTIHKAFHNTYKYGNNTEKQFEDFLLVNFQLDWKQIKIALQQGNHQPSSFNCNIIKEKVQRLEGDQLNSV